MNEQHTEYLTQARELLRRVELTLDDDETEQELVRVIMDLETLMSDSFDIALPS